MAPREDNRLVGYLGNWQSCPNPQQLEQYTTIVVGFAVTYTYNAAKNKCSPTCEIATPPICGNGANGNLIDSMHRQGKKVIISFGGAGMGGSWEGDINDCWDYCFGREEQTVNRLVEIVQELNLDGVDLDYEYFYEDDQGNSTFTKGAAAQKFIREVTLGLRRKLPAGSTLAHAPMDADMVPGTAYYEILKDIGWALDYLMPQLYNGVSRPHVDGFTKSGEGEMAAADLYANMLNDFFDGDATRMVFGFCINDCAGTESNANSDQAAAVMREVNEGYDCHGGAFFWVVEHDYSGLWSSVVNEAISDKRGCSRTPGEPTRAPITPPPVPIEPCCPTGLTGLLVRSQASGQRKSFRFSRDSFSFSFFSCYPRLPHCRHPSR
jgi:chitinase